MLFYLRILINASIFSLVIFTATGVSFFWEGRGYWEQFSVYCGESPEE
jgi:hypothetical protein